MYLARLYYLVILLNTSPCIYLGLCVFPLAALRRAAFLWAALSETSDYFH